MALFRCSIGGGSVTPDVNIANPDVMGYQTMNANTTKQVTVTQLPKFVILYEQAVSNSFAGVYVYNVAENTNYTGYKRSGTNLYQEKGVSGLPDRFDSVTNTKVTFENSTSTKRDYFWAIYY